jgi:hypothetical protein
LALCAPLFATRLAFAQGPSSVELQWDAPARCPSQRAVMDRVRALAGSTSESRGPIRAEAHVESAHDGRGGLRLTLTVRYGQTTGTRVITSSSCEDLVGATAVAISLLLGTESGATPDETMRVPASASGPPASGGPAGSGSGGPASAVPASGARAPGVPASGALPSAANHTETAGAPKSGHTEGTPSAPSARRWHIDVRAPALLVDVGSLPNAGFGFGAAAAFRYDAFRVALGGALWLSQTITSDDGPSPAGAGLDRWSLDLAGCRAWPAGKIEVAPCVSLSLDDVSARGTGPQVNPVSVQTSWVSLGPEVLGSLRLTDYAALVLGVSARWAMSQPRFVVAGLGELYQVSPVTAEALLGCDWIL